MARAVFNGVVIAESDDVEMVEGNHYFPISSLNRDYVTESDLSSQCHWKGKASYWNVVVGDEEAADAAWYYPAPKDGAKMVTDRVAFYAVVDVSD